MTNSNKKWRLLNVRLGDFDAVSLYPSAMNRMLGFLKGTPKVIKKENLNYEFLEKQDGYFIEIVIRSVGIKRDFPLLSYINQNGVRNFTNDMVGRTVYIDKVGLEDFKHFQNGTFEVLRGYYFNEGRNNKINKP